MVEARGNQYLTKHEVPLGQLNEHLLGAKRIVELKFEIFDLLFGILEHNEDGLVRVYERLCQGLGERPVGYTHSGAPPGWQHPFPYPRSSFVAPGRSPARHPSA